MPFIGTQPRAGAYSVLDSITVTATDTFNLTLDGAAYYPQSANHLIVSINGTMQAPINSFTISGSQIIFSENLLATDVIDFILALGDTLSIGVPSANAVTTSSIQDGAVTDAKLASTFLKSSDIGTSIQAYDADTAKLDVAQTFTANQTFSNDIAVNGLTVGKGANSVDNCTALGISALSSGSLSGISNTAVGENALRDNTTGGANTAVGLGALVFNTGGFHNTGIGTQAIRANTTGSYNSALGYQALYNNTTANNNTAVGYQALYDNTTGINLVAVGHTALRNNTIGNNNVAVGRQSQFANTEGTSNTSIGHLSLTSNTTGSQNTAVGQSTLLSNTTANNNTAVGYLALYLTTGGNNTALGEEAGDTLTTGTNNTLLGYNAQPSSATVSNEITLGNASVTTLRVPALDFSINSGSVSAKSYKETVYAVTGTTPAIAATNGNVQTWTLSGNSTPTDGLNAGESITLMIDDGSAYTITWTSLVDQWIGGSAPTLATTGYSVVELWKVSTTVYGAYVGDAS